MFLAQLAQDRPLLIGRLGEEAIRIAINIYGEMSMNKSAAATSPRPGPRKFPAAAFPDFIFVPKPKARASPRRPLPEFVIEITN